MRYVKNIAVVCAYCSLLFSLITSVSLASGLVIQKNRNNTPYLVYGNRPVFAYGASPQNILTYLPRGNGNDIKDWVAWATKFGINNVRSYPPSIRVETPALNLFEYASPKKDQFDLNQFNQSYFDALREACLLLKQKGMIVHLQLWQGVYWQVAWNKCYYNPKNNINPDICAHAGPGEFVTMKNKALLDHQKQYVNKVLDTTADLGNVFYDIVNEIGNGTGKNKAWVNEMIRTIHQWERAHDMELLITLNDEGGLRMKDFSLKNKGLDLIIKDLGRYEEHVKARANYGKPTISVRNIDYNYAKRSRRYFAGRYNLEINEDPEIQARGRKYWWRMYMAGAQIAGAYADTYSRADTSLFFRALDKIALKCGVFGFFEAKPSYAVNTLSEQNFKYFRKFISQVPDYETLEARSGVLRDHPVANSYCLQSPKQAVVYAESPNGRAGVSYKAQKSRIGGLILKDGLYQGTYYFPYNGKSEFFLIEIKDGEGGLYVPAFEDDIAIRIF